MSHIKRLYLKYVYKKVAQQIIIIFSLTITLSIWQIYERQTHYQANMCRYVCIFEMVPTQLFLLICDEV